MTRSPLPLAALILAAAAIMGGLAQPAAAQQEPPPATTGSIAPMLPTAPAAPSAPAEGPQLPGPEQMLFLIRTTLLTLNDANRTGNYSVLRDLAAPAFQAQNTAADLAMVFADLRRGAVDLGAVAIRNPEMRGGASIGEHGILKLRGVAPGKPVPARFELLFQPVAGQWRLIGLAIAAAPPSGPIMTPAAPKDTAAPPKAETGAGKGNEPGK